MLIFEKIYYLPLNYKINFARYNKLIISFLALDRNKISTDFKY